MTDTTHLRNERAPGRSGATHERTDESWWKTTWPLGKPDWKQLAAWFIGVVLAGTVVGFLLTDLTAPNAITEFDLEVTERAVDSRTQDMDSQIHWGAFPADTLVKLGASIVIAAGLLWRFRRWHEALFLGLTLAFEASAFTAITYIVQRPRPDVDRLVDSPVSTSFPSGHVAAATVWGALAIIVFWHTRKPLYRALAVVGTAVIPIIVGFARIYQGMHYFSDVVAGIILGLATLAICYRIMGPPPGAVRPSAVSERRSDQVRSDRASVA